MKRLVQGYCYPGCCVDVISFFMGDVRLHTYISSVHLYILYILYQWCLYRTKYIQDANEPGYYMY